MKDLISIDQLSIDDIENIHNRALFFYNNSLEQFDYLKNKLLLNFFFENSTRTRMSFEIAMKRLGGKVLNIDISLSSLKKGESIIDTAKTINAMQPDFVAIRHNSSGIASFLKQYIDSSLINAGDGTNEHPSQALLDSFVIKKHKKTLRNLKIAICGDVLHSRVARSNIKLLKKYGCEIRIITPPTLAFKECRDWLYSKWNINVYENIVEGIKDVDVIMMLRIQQERMVGCYIPSLQEYFEVYGLDYHKLKLAKKAIVLHPGPINREVEIATDLADDQRVSLILDQVKAGVAVRQAILMHLVE